MRSAWCLFGAARCGDTDATRRRFVIFEGKHDVEEDSSRLEARVAH